jgi:hypothetical protein
MTARFKDYLHEAFNAKPWGMFVPPNWVGLAAFGLLGALNPGFWLVGAGLELAYLVWLTGSARFRKIVDQRLAGDAGKRLQADLDARLQTLSPPDADRFRSLEKRCQAILDRQRAADALLQDQSEGLGRLLWIFLHLLASRQKLRHIISESRDDFSQKAKRLDDQIQLEKDEALRQSLSSQLDIVRQREATQKEGRTKITFLESELERIEQQVELIREQALLTGDPAGLSRRIDEAGASLTGTSQWIHDQQKLYDEIEALVDEPPPMFPKQIQ